MLKLFFSTMLVKNPRFCIRKWACNKSYEISIVDIPNAFENPEETV